MKTITVSPNSKFTALFAQDELMESILEKWEGPATERYSLGQHMDRFDAVFTATTSQWLYMMALAEEMDITVPGEVKGVDLARAIFKKMFRNILKQLN